jgi:cell division protein ZapA
MGDDVIRRVKVKIGGTEYTLRGTENEQTLLEIAKLVDSVMQTVSEANPNLDPKRIAVLTALNIAEELVKLREQYESLLELLDERTRA